MKAIRKEMDGINKTAVIIALILGLSFLSYGYLKYAHKSGVKEGWNFVGYQYRWSKDYVENPGFASQLECVQFGNEWLKKQASEETLFTCALNCKPEKSAPGIDICEKVCEYDGGGLTRCRK